MKIITSLPPLPPFFSPPEYDEYFMVSFFPE